MASGGTWATLLRPIVFSNVHHVVLSMTELLDWKSEVVGQPGQVDQCGKFDRSADHESSEIDSSFVKY
ncbi:hypothetical protein L3X38_033351 [Prunus dulcis]|uniref:Uncharacterized protein n=1 Tax=Prunus dulcis TaxID=3755 RepID=A0AAD4YXI9_PRUDU|nr:hypothetical protein L3X38_033351 [Prunus dulcis]